jgi:trigger factor
MKTELIDISPTKKEIKIEIEPAQIRTAYDRISDEYAKAATVPGFRRGHAPRSVVRNRYKSEIRSEVLRELLPDAVNSAIGEHSLSAIGEPDVHLDNTDALETLGDKPITVKVGVEVFPEVTLATYKGLDAVKRIRPVTEDDIDKAIEGLREASASMQPVEDRAAELGDTVTINVQGTFVDQSDEEDIKVEDVEVVLGGEGVQPEFTENLKGTKPDESRDFIVDYPADFTSAGLAGKKVDYKVQVTAVRRRELPEVDDEWAKSLGDEFDSVSTLRAKIKGDLEQRSGHESSHRLRSDVMKKLLEGHQFEVPQTLVDQQASHRLESVVRDMIARGIDPRNRDVNWDGAREELKVQAEEDVRATMLLDRIADEEKIDVSDDEVEAEIDAIANASRQPREQVRAALTKDGGERSIAHRLRNRKALDFLIENAHVTEEEWSEEENVEGASTQDE